VGSTSERFFFVLALACVKRSLRLAVKPFEIALLLLMAIVTPLEVIGEMFGLESGNRFRFWLGVTTGVGIVGLCYMMPSQIKERSAGGLNVIGIAAGLGVLSVCLLSTDTFFASAFSRGLFLLSSEIGFFVFIASVVISASRVAVARLGNHVG
jgi:hypothetical protein